MEIDDLRAMTDAELTEERDATHRELMNLRFRWMTHQLANVAEMKRVKKTIARIKTVMRERELGIR